MCCILVGDGLFWLIPGISVGFVACDNGIEGFAIPFGVGLELTLMGLILPYEVSILLRREDG